MKLKTLKDIWYFGHKHKPEHILRCTKEGTRLINDADLKQAAREWIENLESRNKKAKGIIEEQEAIWNKIMIKWIKHFFNLEEKNE